MTTKNTYDRIPEEINDTLELLAEKTRWEPDMILELAKVSQAPKQMKIHGFADSIGFCRHGIYTGWRLKRSWNYAALQRRNTTDATRKLWKLYRLFFLVQF